jgi:chemotaxis protein methyltransferase CheR
MTEIFDDDLVAFLQWALPKMGYRWAGFRKVRGQVKKRISRRLDELGLATLDAYRDFLQDNPQEFDVLDSYCRITISRFYRDRQTWDDLRTRVLPELADRARNEGRHVLRAWSLGCASGEEPYTLSLCWNLDEARPWAGLDLTIDAIDASPHMIERARQARYPMGATKELPATWRAKAFHEVDDDLQLRPTFKQPVRLAVADIRELQPSTSYDLVLCRNLAFMYFDARGRAETLQMITAATFPGAALVVGNHDILPDGHPGFEAYDQAQHVWRRKK